MKIVPIGEDKLAAWLEKHHITIEISCVFSKYEVRMGWKKVHSYSDAKGEHSETWDVTRRGTSLSDVIQECAEATGLAW